MSLAILWENHSRPQTAVEFAGVITCPMDAMMQPRELNAKGAFTFAQSRVVENPTAFWRTSNRDYPMIIQFSLDHLPLFEAKLLAKCQGRTAFEVFAIEVFSGTSRLTAAIRQLGFRRSFGVDHVVSKKLVAPVVQLDLTNVQNFQFLQEMIREPGCLFVHLAPPCGTASRARFIKRRGRYNPPVLRTDDHPNMWKSYLV